MPQDTPSRKLEQYILRFPDGMRDRLKVAAAENNRSLNAEIIARLESSFGPTPANTLYVLLDANGHPTSWQEISSHLSQISEAGDFSPEMIEARVFNAELASNGNREGQWLDLLEHYRALHGLPPLFPDEEEQQ